MTRVLRTALLGVAAAALMSAAAMAAGDPEEGAQVFRTCAACHQVGEGAQNGVGPHLNGLFGRPAGTAEGYRYSPAMIEAGSNGLIWTEETVAEHLRDPRGFIPRNRMGFAGLRSDQQVADVISYLEQFSQ